MKTFLIAVLVVVFISCNNNPECSSCPDGYSHDSSGGLAKKDTTQVKDSTELKDSTADSLVIYARPRSGSIYDGDGTLDSTRSVDFTWWSDAPDTSHLRRTSSGVMEYKNFGDTWSSSGDFGKRDSPKISIDKTISGGRSGFYGGTSDDGLYDIVGCRSYDLEMYQIRQRKTGL